MLYFFVRYIEILRKDINCRKKFRCLFFYCGLVDGLIILLEIDIVVLFGEIFGYGFYEFGFKRRI